MYEEKLQLTIQKIKYKKRSTQKYVGTIPDTESWSQLTSMCELAFIEYNPTFDSIMPFPCFFDVTRKTSK
jgi:hypothetical protein